MTITILHPHLVDQVLIYIKIPENKKEKSTPVSSSKLLLQHSDPPEFENPLHYRPVIGKLNSIETVSRSDITYTVHPCDSFSKCPNKEHGNGIRWISIYIIIKRNQVTILQTDTTIGI